MERTPKNPQKMVNLHQNSKSKLKPQGLKVFVRTRPVIRSEFGKETAITCDTNNRQVRIDTKSNIIESYLDATFDENSSQLDVFKQIQDFIPSVIQGYNCTVFAYGQTGSGKTHTMFGSDWENVVFRGEGNIPNIQKTYIGDLDEDRNFCGLIPRTVYHLFKEIQKEANQAQKFVIYCSFLQIYNEKIFDLLNGKSTTNSLDIRENKIDGIYVEGLSEYAVSNFQDCLKLMQRGEKNRFIRHTSNNVKSSRSHTIFQLIVESTKADASGNLQKAKFNLCDLAGSEKLKKSEDIVDAHLRELKNINLSLTTLGKVIHSLSQNKKIPIPYRESKLTRLLQDSLGGNTKTCLIATLSPILEYVDESINTLKFAERAKHIVTEVKANKIEAQDAELVQKLQKEIKYLKAILNIRRKGTSAINQVHNKLLILQEENDRLRNAHFSVSEVERLMEENRNMKMELQHIKLDAQSESAAGGPREFDASNGLSNYSKTSNFGTKSAVEKKIPDILDNIQGDEAMKRESSASQNQFRKTNPYFEQVLRGQDSGIHNYFEGINSPVSVNQNSFMASSKFPPSQTPSHKSNFESKVDSLTDTETKNPLPLRIRGKKTVDTKSEDTKYAQAIQKADARKKEQERALRRLKDLEEWQRNIRSKDRFESVKETRNQLQHAESQSNSVVSTHFDGKATLNLDSKSVSNAHSESKIMTSSERRQLIPSANLESKVLNNSESRTFVPTASLETKTMTNSESKLLVSNGSTKVTSNVDAKTTPTPNTYQFADFDKLYNPYKVRQEIEKKYNGTNQSHLIQKTPSNGKLPVQKPLGSNSSRLKLIEKNFF